MQTFDFSRFPKRGFQCWFSIAAILFLLLAYSVPLWDWSSFTREPASQGYHAFGFVALCVMASLACLMTSVIASLASWRKLDNKTIKCTIVSILVISFIVALTVLNWFLKVLYFPP